MSGEVLPVFAPDHWHSRRTHGLGIRGAGFRDKLSSKLPTVLFTLLQHRRNRRKTNPGNISGRTFSWDGGSRACPFALRKISADYEAVGLECPWGSGCWVCVGEKVGRFDFRGVFKIGMPEQPHILFRRTRQRLLVRRDTCCAQMCQELLGAVICEYDWGFLLEKANRHVGVVGKDLFHLPSGFVRLI